MTVIADLYKYAALSTGTYVQMGARSLTGQSLASEANAQANGRIPTVLGQYLFDPQPGRPNAESWKAIHYYGADAPHIQDATGFAATLFQQGQNGEKVLALRGTEPFVNGLSLLDPDLLRAGLGGIGILGMAVSQVVSMVNLIEQLKAPAGTQIQKIRVEATLTRPSEPGVQSVDVQGTVPVYLKFSTYTDGTTGLGLISEAEKITVTGHSLGGHLAVLAARLYPNLVRPDIYVYNAAGVDPLTGAFIGPLLKLLIIPALAADLGDAALKILPVAQQLTDRIIGKLAAFLASPPDTNFSRLVIHNVESEDLAPGNDASLVASVIGGSPVLGPEVFVSTEANSHLIEPLMDALALQALIATLSDSITLTDVTKLLQASSNVLVRSEEALTEALARIVLGSEVAFLDEDGINRTRDTLLTSDAISGRGLFKLGKGALSARAAFHDAVLRIGDATKNKSYQLVSLVGEPIATAGKAQLDAGYFFALRELNPFAIVDADALYAETQHNLFMKWRDDRSSSAADQHYSNSWLTDRAQFLARKIERNNADATGVLRDSKLLGALNYQDRTTGESVRIIGPAGSERFVIFGMDAVDETITGQGGDDRLYGASGSDVIRGGSGADYLEGSDNRDFLGGESGDDRIVGGAGDDVLDGGPGIDELFGGSGNDMYEYHAGEGVDTITDSDGQGFIRFWGRTAITDLKGGKQRGPNLWATDDGLYRYSLFREEDGTDTLGIFSGSDVLFVSNFTSSVLGIVLQDAPQPPASPPKVFPQTPGNDFYVWGSTAAGAHLQGLAGNDFLIVEPYSVGIQEGSLVEGGTGNDALSGGSGADRLFSETQDDLTSFLDGSASTVAGIGREVALAYVGDDLLVAGRGNDWLGGGLGRDTIYGGAGDDVISGSGDAYFEQVLGSEPQEMLVFNVHDSALSGSAVLSFLAAAATGDRIIRQGLNDQSPLDEGDTVFAGAGDDEVWGDYGDDQLIGESGRDTIRGEAGHDALFGGAGDDVLYGDGEQVPLAQQGDTTSTAVRARTCCMAAAGATASTAVTTGTSSTARPEQTFSTAKLEPTNSLAARARIPSQAVLETICCKAARKTIRTFSRLAAATTGSSTNPASTASSSAPAVRQDR